MLSLLWQPSTCNPTPTSHQAVYMRALTSVFHRVRYGQDTTSERRKRATMATYLHGVPLSHIDLMAQLLLTTRATTPPPTPTPYSTTSTPTKMQQRSSGEKVGRYPPQRSLRSCWPILPKSGLRLAELMDENSPHQMAITSSSLPQDIYITTCYTT